MTKPSERRTNGAEAEVEAEAEAKARAKAKATCCRRKSVDGVDE
jgi:hypothetical protein